MSKISKPVVSSLMGLKPSSPFGVIGQVVRVNPGGIAYARVPVASFANNATTSSVAPVGIVQISNVRVLGLTPGRKSVFIDESGSGGSAGVVGETQIVPFTFDKIVNYRGETPEQIGLLEGAVIELDPVV